MKPAPRIRTELGWERHCAGCDEFWPEDEEFWFIRLRPPAKPHYTCRACRAERERRRAA